MNHGGDEIEGISPAESGNVGLSARGFTIISDTVPIAIQLIWIKNGGTIVHEIGYSICIKINTGLIELIAHIPVPVPILI
jgi:hypothetical protein